MFQKILKALSIFKNLENIKNGVTIFYTSICKVLNTLKFIETQINDTKLGSSLKQYLPETIKILEKIKEIIEKYGEFIGFVAPADAQNLIVVDDLRKELITVSKQLDGLV